MSKKMECQKCQSKDGILKEFPFKLKEILLRSPFENKDVLVHECISCKSLYIGVGIQVYDDNLSYWAAATESEVEELIIFKEKPEIFNKAKQFIEAKPFHIFCDRNGKYCFKQGQAVILSHSASW